MVWRLWQHRDGRSRWRILNAVRALLVDFSIARATSAARPGDRARRRDRLRDRTPPTFRNPRQWRPHKSDDETVATAPSGKCQVSQGRRWVSRFLTAFYATLRREYRLI